VICDLVLCCKCFRPGLIQVSKAVGIHRLGLDRETTRNFRSSQGPIELVFPLETFFCSRLRSLAAAAFSAILPVFCVVSCVSPWSSVGCFQSALRLLSRCVPRASCCVPFCLLWVGTSQGKRFLISKLSDSLRQIPQMIS
jgi:hypothetical protein